MNHQSVSSKTNPITQMPAKKGRVLMIVGFLWGDEGILRGLATLAKGLMQQGWEVAIASSMEDRDGIERFTRGPKWLESQNIQHFFIPFPNWRTSGKGKFIVGLQALLTLNTVVSQFQPNVINIHSLSLSPYARAMRLFHKIPYVSTARIEPSINRFSVKLGAFINRYEKTFLGNRFIAISTEVKEAYANNLNIPRDNINLICHGVETDHFRVPSLQERLDARATFDLKPEAKVICLIGRLYPIKGHDLLVQSLAILRNQGINVIALCAGAGNQQEQDSIIKQATQLGVANLVRLLGFTDPRQVLWASDVLVLPSRLEGFGWVIPEAMLCGVVPVRTPGGGTLDQIEDGINGFVVPFDDAEALALRLKQLLENDQLRAQMSEAALKSAQQKFTVDKMIEKTIAVYKEVIQKKS